jgi:hypothetical protein
MVRIEFRVPAFLLALALGACGSSEPDFSHPDRGGAGSGVGGAAAGGSGGRQGGAGAMQGGGAGVAAGGTAGTDAAGSASGGAAGSAPSGGASGSATGGSATGGSTGTTQFPCGPLTCFTSQQWCRVTKPPVSGGSTQYMCQPFADSCSAYDCNCVCQHSPCESTATCSCTTDGGGVTVTCGP